MVVDRVVWSSGHGSSQGSVKGSQESSGHGS